MTKTELVYAVVEKTGITKKDTEKVVSALFTEVAVALAHKDTVRITGFGTFSARDRAERKTRNPATGAPVIVPAMTVPVFKAGKTLRDTVR